MSEVRYTQIDFIKGIAAISVILLHTFPLPILFSTFSAYHIWQAVPVFMVLVGYNSAMSNKNRDIRTITGFGYSLLMKRFRKLIIPLLVISIIQVLFQIHFEHQIPEFRSLVKSFILSEWGRGGYFPLLILQYVLVTPIIYILALRNPKKMLILTFFLDIGFNFISFQLKLPSQVYHYVFFRYLFAVGLGCWLAFENEKLEIKPWMIIGSIISLCYITAVCYFGFKLRIEPSWIWQNTPAYVWAMVLVIVGLKKLPETVTNLIGNVMSLIGKSSYHIFLTQMLYFYIIYNLHIITNFPLKYYTAINLLICVSGGVFFYWIDNLTSRKLLRFVKSW